MLCAKPIHEQCRDETKSGERQEHCCERNLRRERARAQQVEHVSSRWDGSLRVSPRCRDVSRAGERGRRAGGRTRRWTTRTHLFRHSRRVKDEHALSACISPRIAGGVFAGKQLGITSSPSWWSSSSPASSLDRRGPRRSSPLASSLGRVDRGRGRVGSRKGLRRVFKNFKDKSIPHRRLRR